MEFDLAHLRHLARLARLDLPEAELEALRTRLKAIVEYVDQLKQLDVEGVPPLDHAAEAALLRRADEPKPGLAPEDALSNAPAVAGPYFTVPRILEAP